MEKTELEQSYEKQIARLEEEVRWLRTHIEVLSKMLPVQAQPIITPQIPQWPNPYFTPTSIPTSPLIPANPWNPFIPITICSTDNFTSSSSPVQ